METLTVADGQAVITKTVEAKFYKEDIQKFIAQNETRIEGLQAEIAALQKKNTDYQAIISNVVKRPIVDVPVTEEKPVE